MRFSIRARQRRAATCVCAPPLVVREKKLMSGVGAGCKSHTFFPSPSTQMPAPPPTRARLRRAPGGSRQAAPPGRIARPPRAAPGPPAPGESSNSSAPPPRPTGATGANGAVPNPVTDPAATVVWGGRLPSRRRVLSSAAAATAITLGGNLGGVTSALLSSSERATAAARAAQLDVILPVRGSKRCAPLGAGYEFTYPAAWLADRTVAERRAAAGERARSLDPPSLSAGVGSSSPSSPPLPDSAFGPPDTAGETNVSVVVAPIMAGFTLAASLGPPREGLEKYLRTVIAPPGSPREALSLAASERVDASGTPYYTWEYRVVGPGFDRTNVSCLAARAVVRPPGPPSRAAPPNATPRLELVTLNAQAPTADFERAGGKLREALREAATSFLVKERVQGRTGL